MQVREHAGRQSTGTPGKGAACFSDLTEFRVQPGVRYGKLVCAFSIMFLKHLKKLSLAGILAVTLLLIASPVFARAQKWQGNTDAMGQVQINISLSESNAFILQGWIKYKGYWRPIPVFWNNQKLWFDLGPEFKDTPYRIVLHTS